MARKLSEQAQTTSGLNSVTVRSIAWLRPKSDHGARGGIFRPRQDTACPLAKTEQPLPAPPVARADAPHLVPQRGKLEEQLIESPVGIAEKILSHVLALRQDKNTQGSSVLKMKVLFISRAYPPVTGGIENQNHALYAWLSRHTPVALIANRHGKKALPAFLPYATLKALFALRRHDVLLLGDGVLGMTGFFAKLFYPKKTVISVVHGLDLTYRSFIYRFLWVRTFLRALDGFIAVSRETRERAIEQGIPAEKVVVIPNGIDPGAFDGTYSRSQLEQLLQEPLAGKFALLTIGRLVKRKGVEWFIRSVLPLLPSSVIYVLAGAGPEEANIKTAVKELRLEQRVRLLGQVSDRDRDILLHTAEIFVQPNISVPGDMEGFGLAVIEAAACARPVVAANIEGLKDAIRDAQNGLLLEAENAEAFRDAIVRLLYDEAARLALGARAREFTAAHYHWNVVSRRYKEALEMRLTQRR